MVTRPTNSLQQEDGLCAVSDVCRGRVSAMQPFSVPTMFGRNMDLSRVSQSYRSWVQSLGRVSCLALEYMELRCVPKIHRQVP